MREFIQAPSGATSRLHATPTALKIPRLSFAWQKRLEDQGATAYFPEMQTIQEALKYATEQGKEAKSKEFVDKDAEVYVKA